MATVGTPYVGLNEFLRRCYVTGECAILAYTNAANSLDASTVFTDLVQPTSTNGYAPITLNGTYTRTNGVMTYVHSVGTNPQWSATGAWSSTVNGYAMYLISGSLLLHFKDFVNGPFTASAGSKIAADISTLTA